MLLIKKLERIGTNEDKGAMKINLDCLRSWAYSNKTKYI